MVVWSGGDGLNEVQSATRPLAEHMPRSTHPTAKTPTPDAESACNGIFNERATAYKVTKIIDIFHISSRILCILFLYFFLY